MKKKKILSSAPTASRVGPCPTIIHISRTSRTKIYPTPSPDQPPYVVQGTWLWCKRSRVEIRFGPAGTGKFSVNLADLLLLLCCRLTSTVHIYGHIEPENSGSRVRRAIDFATRPGRSSRNGYMYTLIRHLALRSLILVCILPLCPFGKSDIRLILLCYCVTSTVNICGPVGRVSLPNHTFPWQAQTS